MCGAGRPSDRIAAASTAAALAGSVGVDPLLLAAISSNKSLPVACEAALELVLPGCVGCGPGLPGLEPAKALLALDAPSPAAAPVTPTKVAPTNAPEHGARVFLQERRTGGCLTIGQSPSGAERILMTRSAVSLFECHRSDGGIVRPTESAAAVPPGMLDVLGVAEDLAEAVIEQIEPDAAESPSRSLPHTAVVSFAHEGLPGFGAFLSAAGVSWWQCWTRQGVSGQKMECKNKSLGLQERFRWLDDGTIQHVPSGMWLYVDPENPDEVLLHGTERSAWEAMPAL